MFSRKVTEVLGLVVRQFYGPPNENLDGVERIEISRHTLALPRLGSAFDSYRLVQISDLHIGTWLTRSRLHAVVEMVNREQPDLVAITGDFVTYEPERFADDLVQSLRRLKARDAVVAVLGNHDHWTDSRLVRRVLQLGNVLELSNRVHTLQRGEDRLHVAGVDDVMENLDRLDEVLARLPAEGAAILLAHEPDFAERSAACGRFDLQLSGHTHGGQIVFPLFGSPFLPPYGVKYPSGRYLVNGMVQYTNRGIGTTSLRLRLNCPAEIAVFTLKPGPLVKAAPGSE